MTERRIELGVLLPPRGTPPVRGETLAAPSTRSQGVPQGLASMAVSQLNTRKRGKATSMRGYYD